MRKAKKRKQERNRLATENKIILNKKRKARKEKRKTMATSLNMELNVNKPEGETKDENNTVQ